MKSAKQTIQKRISLAWILLILGIVIFLTGILLEISVENKPFNLRIISGLGIVFLAAGAGMLVKYRQASKDETAARRLMIEAGDERVQMIRSKAGHRAFWTSMLITYLILLWVSFSSNGSLPVLTQDMLWYALSLAVLIPFGVYVSAIITGEKNQ